MLDQNNDECPDQGPTSGMIPETSLRCGNCGISVGSGSIESSYARSVPSFTSGGINVCSNCAHYLSRRGYLLPTSYEALFLVNGCLQQVSLPSLDMIAELRTNQARVQYLKGLWEWREKIQWKH